MRHNASRLCITVRFSTHVHRCVVVCDRFQHARSTVAHVPIRRIQTRCSAEIAKRHTTSTLATVARARHAASSVSCRMTVLRAASATKHLS